MTTVTHARNPRVYLAGKIAQKQNWRNDIVVEPYDNGWGHRIPFAFASVEEALRPDRVVTALTWGGEVDICGPFFVAMDHQCVDFTTFHTVGDEGEFTTGRAMQQRVHAVNVERIRRADLVFACIDETDCFGTIAEIGFAHGVGTPVHLYFGENITKGQRRELWFVARCADHVHECVTIQHAFVRSLRGARQRRGERPRLAAI